MASDRRGREQVVGRRQHADVALVGGLVEIDDHLALGGGVPSSLASRVCRQDTPLAVWFSAMRTGAALVSMSSSGGVSLAGVAADESAALTAAWPADADEGSWTKTTTSGPRPT